MKVISRKWFEVSVRYAKINEQGIAKPITEIVVVDAQSFGEAEMKADEEYSRLSTIHEVVAVKLAMYKEVAIEERDEKTQNVDMGFYKVKVKMITFDERAEKEKKTSVWFLVEAKTLQNALTSVDAIMKDSMQNYEKATGTETRIVEVLTKEK